MSQLATFWGETDRNGAYINKEYGSDAEVKKAADEWLVERGLDPTEI